MRRRDWLVLLVLFGLLFALMSWGVYTYFTSLYTGGNDFYSRWAGAVALLRDGRDPYSLEVTREIQLVKDIDPALEGKGSFAYPLPVIFLFLPLAYVSYTWALAVWMVLLIWIGVGCVVLLLLFVGWRPALWGTTLLIIGTLFLYPVIRTILLGQFTLHVTLFLVLMLWLLQHGRDGWAGAVLALTIVKPQMVVLILPWFVLWAMFQRRWHFIGGVIGGGLALLLLSLPLFPRWPLAFIEDIQRYAPVAGGKNPFVLFGDYLIPGGGTILRWGLTLLLLLLTAWKCWLGLRSHEESFLRATYWVITVSLLIVFQTGTTNQVLLLIPLFDWLYRLSRVRYGGWGVTAVMLSLVIFPWLLFLNTIQGNAESAVMFLPLPSLSLVVLLGIELGEWRSGRPLASLISVAPAT